MTLQFEFNSAGRIIFGAGTVRGLGRFAREFGRRALVVTGRNPSRANPLLVLLSEQGVVSHTFAVAGEPRLSTIHEGIAAGRAAQSDLVIGFGGGSALDAAKAIAAMLANDGELLDYVEIIGQGRTLSKPPLPCIAIPTTAGTGSEVTRNSVLGSPEHRLKVSLRSPLMLPRIALVDPELTYDLPPEITASTGLDALTQLIEPYVCLRANPMTDAFCVEGIGRAAKSLRRAVENGRDCDAREGMCIASLFGGLALANAGLGAVHGFAGPIGGMFSAPHGAVCAALLPHVMRLNLQALQQRQPGSAALQRYENIGRLLTGRATATATDGIEWVEALIADLETPRLGRFGITSADTPELVAKAANASSMKANPIALSTEELASVLAAAL